MDFLTFSHLLDVVWPVSVGAAAYQIRESYPAKAAAVFLGTKIYL